MLAGWREASGFNKPGSAGLESLLADQLVLSGSHDKEMDRFYELFLGSAHHPITLRKSPHNGQPIGKENR